MDDDSKLGIQEAEMRCSIEERVVEADVSGAMHSKAREVDVKTLSPEGRACSRKI